MIRAKAKGKTLSLRSREVQRRGLSQQSSMSYLDLSDGLDCPSKGNFMMKSARKISSILHHIKGPNAIGNKQ